MSVPYYLVVNNQRKGPIERENLIGAGLRRDTLVWHDGLPNWICAAEVPELTDLMSTIPPPLPGEAAGGPPPIPPPSTEVASRPPAGVAAGARIERVLWLWVAILSEVGAVLTNLGAFVLILASTDAAIYPAYFVLFLSSLCSLGGYGLFLYLLFRLWDLIQDGHARTTPAKAAGFMLIPFFNLYWVFVAVGGLASDLAAFLERRKIIPVAPVSLKLALAYCILFVASSVLVCVPLLSIASAVVLVLFLDAVTRVASQVDALGKAARP